MGTKRNPGKYDCYEKAEPDEPMFVLLGRDSVAPTLVEAWANSCLEAEKSYEAQECARAMRKYRRGREARNEEAGRTLVAAQERLERAAVARQEWLEADKSHHCAIPEVERLRQLEEQTSHELAVATRELMAARAAQPR
jgi:hypothetical protein